MRGQGLGAELQHAGEVARGGDGRPDVAGQGHLRRAKLDLRAPLLLSREEPGPVHRDCCLLDGDAEEEALLLQRKSWTPGARHQDDRFVGEPLVDAREAQTAGRGDAADRQAVLVQRGIGQRAGNPGESVGSERPATIERGRSEGAAQPDVGALEPQQAGDDLEEVPGDALRVLLLPKDRERQQRGQIAQLSAQGAHLPCAFFGRHEPPRVSVAQTRFAHATPSGTPRVVRRTGSPGGLPR